MSDAIHQWLAGRDKGASSEAIAMTALGHMPRRPEHPRDGADFGRCYRLIEAAPEARAAVDVLARDGGAYWAVLGPVWDRLSKLYADEADIYPALRDLLEPVENADPTFIRLGPGISMRFGA